MKGSGRQSFNGTVSLQYTYKNLIFNNQTTITTNKATESKYGSFSDYASMQPYWRTHDADGNLIKSYDGISNAKFGNPLHNASLNTYDVSKSLQVWKYDKEKDILSYSTVTKNNIKRPYFIKIKNGLNFVSKKYVGESMTDDAKLTITNEEGAIGILGEEILSVQALLN